MTDEEAKATQEVARATSKAIEASEKLGSFLSEVFGEPIKTSVGILQDRLSVIRWERQLHLADRVRQIISERGITLSEEGASPKLAIPILENASIEPDDYLQDLWANLLAAAMTKPTRDKVRTAFVGIIKELESVDVKMLEVIFKLYCDGSNNCTEDYETEMSRYSPANLTAPIFKNEIIETLVVEEPQYYESIDNLLRLRLVASYVSGGSIDTEVEGSISSYEVSQHWGSEAICITSLGHTFVEICAPYADEGDEEFLDRISNRAEVAEANRKAALSAALDQIELRFGKGTDDQDDEA